MKNFEEKKLGYLLKLYDNMEILLLFSKSKDPGCVKIAKMLMEPKDDNELRVASSILDWSVDVKMINEAWLNGNLEYVSPDKNKGLNDCIDIVRLMLNGENYQEKINLLFGDIGSGEVKSDEIAKFVFDITMAFVISRDQAANYFCKKLNITEENFEDYFARVNDLSSNMGKNPTAKNTVKPSDIEKLISNLESIVSEFHKLYVERIANEKTEDLQEWTAELVKKIFNLK